MCHITVYLEEGGWVCAIHTSAGQLGRLETLGQELTLWSKGGISSPSEKPCFFFSFFSKAIQLMDKAHPYSSTISYLSSLIVDANHYIMPSQGELDSRLIEQLCAIVYLNWHIKLTISCDEIKSNKKIKNKQKWTITHGFLMFFDACQVKLFMSWKQRSIQRTY